MGPFKLIGSVSHEQGLAHSRFAAVFLMKKDGPIQGFRQHFSGVTMGPSKVCGSVSHEKGWAHPSVSAVFLMSKNGPIQGLWQHF